ncbi:phage GP46 family protein [Vibrio splendidus]|uniref:phage GP46 family protein n=1 Tax=Vibrio splendidus TaxID=29497 RepID=UPI0022362F49|nr:phage GP46 family protein [Vibrio splendidus]MCW4444015.1 phage GP46 family protein [Vibrio splendidus]
MNHFKLNALTSPINSKEGMSHAVLQSVHNYAESTQNDRARMDSDERGGTWSSDVLNIVGSRDWTLKRDKVTTQTITLAKRFYQSALQWLIDDGHAKKVDVTTWEEAPNVMGRNVTITLTNGTQFEVAL